MRAPLSWLRDFAPFGNDVGELARALDELGLVVEEVDRVGEGLGDVVVARVLATRRHPDADRVQLVDVDRGKGDPIQVVCGAFNFAAGDLVPLAPVGSALPNGMEIGRRKVRGEWSEGMLCSAAELGVSSDHAGILVLPYGADPGQPLTDALGIRPDVVFDLEVTPNRPDAMSVAGVARDLAARLRLPFAIPDPVVPEGSGAAGDRTTVVVEAPDLCPRFTARVIEGVAVGPAPEWLTGRLVLAGMRPISNVVDVSNYVMLELGHPNHPYDRERLGGGGLRVRRARARETIVTLDGVERVLSEDDCLICDADDAPVGIGGIMGGASSEISDATSTVVLETAYFEPTAIARTSKRLGLRTEASARFERGVDEDGVARAADRFCALLAECGGPAAAVAAGIVDVRDRQREPVRVRVRTGRVNALLGTQLSTSEVQAYLDPIGFRAEPAGDVDVLDVVIPSWRPDSTREIDVVEEVARHHGYGAVPRTMPPVTRVGALTPYQRDRRRARDVLVGLGVSEAVTSTFVGPTDLERAGYDREAVRVANPLQQEESLLRPSLLPALLKVVVHNASHRNPDVSLFDVGHVFSPPPEGEERPVEREHLGVVLAGEDARAAVRTWRTLADALRVADVSLEQDVVRGLHPTRAVRVRASGQRVGALGEVDPGVLAAHDVDGRVGWMELDLEALLAAPRRPATYAPVSRYPSSDVDLAFVVRDDVPAAAVEATLRDAAGDLLAWVRLFDVYRDDALGTGNRSLAYRVRLDAVDRTLTEAEVADVRRRCIEAVERAHDAQLRG